MEKRHLSDRAGRPLAVGLTTLALSWPLVPAAAQTIATASTAGRETVGISHATKDQARSLVAGLEAVDTAAWRTGNSARTRELARKAGPTSTGADTGKSTMVASSAATSAIIDRATMVRSTVADAGLRLTDYHATSTHKVVVREGTPTVEVTVDRVWTEVGGGETTPVGATEVYRVPLKAAVPPGALSASSLTFASESEGTADGDGGPVSGAEPLPAPTQTERPVVSSVEDPVASAEAVERKGLAAASYIYNFRWRDFAAYGKKWTASPYNGDKKSDLNSKYPYYGNNCANFVSQMWNNSGWKRTGGVNPYLDGNWDDNLSGPAGASRTWSVAKDLYNYADDKKHLYKLGNIWNAAPGNTYFMDWDGNKVINHVAGVTGRTSTGIPRISQKTNNRHDMLLTTWKRLVDHDNPNVRWCGLRRTASQ